MDIVTKAIRWYAGLLILSLIWLYFQKKLNWPFFLRTDLFGLGLDLVLGVGLAAALILFSLFASRNFMWGQMLEREFLRILTPLAPWRILVLGLSSGITEEIFFRGALKNATGLFFSSLLFGMAHLIPRRDLLPWAFYATLVGFIFGCVVDLKQTLLPVILAHSAMNVILITLLNRKVKAK